MVNKEGYSQTCAACFGATIACTAKDCPLKCMGGDTPACKQCVQANCSPAFNTCSGLTPPSQVSTAIDLVADAGACTNSADQQVWTSKGQANFEADMNACGHSSLGDQDKATICMVGKEGYSQTCAACFGATIACTAKDCLLKCMGGETDDCKQCVQENCSPAFNTCSGLTIPSEVSTAIALVADAGACTNAADQQVWTSKGQANFKADMTACGHSSLGNQDKATSCMEGKEGYSQTCAACFGATIAFTAKDCL